MTAGLERPAELGGGSLGQDSRGIGLVEPGGRRPLVPLRGGKGWFGCVSSINGVVFVAYQAEGESKLERNGARRARRHPNFIL